MSDNIKVVVKVRPLISREIEDKLSYQWRVKNNTLYQLDSSGKESGVQFTFDKVYDESAQTADVYKDVAKPIVEAAIAGFNGTIFAYGQTSSGKTYTMSGTETSPGIIQLAVLNLFEQIKCIPDRDFLVRVSYIEIYNESLKDLLNGDNEKIKIRDTLQGVKVDATEKFTSSPEEVMDIMKEGDANRQIGATNMNEESSRSHSIFQITIESREHTEGDETAGSVNVSQLNLVDLAGSERAGQTGATGKRFKEGTHINKSLSVLALVIKQLSEDPLRHANYRDSKLTRILQNSLGGNAKTSIICAVTPAAVEETISTLQFANRAKAIKNKPEVNAVATDATKLQDLTKQLSKLQSELATKNNIEQDNRNLLKQIQNLQKMILNGFGQRSIDIGGARRKTWCAPRRMTISTTSLRPVEEDVEATVQRFCTPSLKYNPLSLPTPRDFQPIQRPSQLPSVSEERAMVTPPPKDKKVNFNDEIIDLDSDDDNASNTSRCSPYHKCFNKSETPPCVLRKNAKMAEKNLKDIVELTSRERLYNPDVVEYMEKLEQSTSKIAKLEDEIKSLNITNIEKDSEMEQLKDVIKQTKIEIETFSSAKAELEARCKEYNTQLTDLEVSYETLRTKAKLREDELLSLLSEHTGNKKPKETISGRSLSRTLDKDFGNFMDMSKDISLVSDNDTSIDSSNNEPSGQLQRLIDEMRMQIEAKNGSIDRLETDLLQQKLNIQSLESTCTELRDEINKTNSKLQYTEEENGLLKTSIETLNFTIKSQKENLESANNDIQSYNVVIKELQAKIVDRTYDNIDLNVSDTLLDKMISNEEQFIANNENMKNIINSFKTALRTRNEEIEQLKANLKYEAVSSNTEMLSEQLEEKEKQVIRLVEEAHTYKEKIQENINVINKLIEDNKDLVKSADDLSSKLISAEQQSSELEKRVMELEKENKTYYHQLHEFNENHDRLLKNLNDFKSNIAELEKEKEEMCELQRKVLDKDNLIAELESKISSKDSVINALNNGQTESQNNLYKWKSTITTLHQFLSVYTGEVILPAEFTEDTSIFDILCSQLNNIQNSVKEIVSQKELAAASNNKLQEEIRIIQSQMESVIQDKNKIESDKENIIQQMSQLKKDIIRLENELAVANNNKLHEEVEMLQSQVESLIRDKNEIENDRDNQLELIVQLKNDIAELEKDLEVAKNNKLQEKITILQSHIESLMQNKQEIENDRDSQIRQVVQLKKDISELEKKVCELNKQNEELNQKLLLVNQSYDILHNDIIEKDNFISNIKKEEHNLRLQLEKLMQLDLMSRSEIENLQAIIKTNETRFNDILKVKSDEVIAAKHDAHRNECLFDETCIELQKVSKKLEETIYNRDDMLDNIYKAAVILIKKFENYSNEYESIENIIHSNIYNNVIKILDRIRATIESTNFQVNNCEFHETIELLDMVKEQNQQLLNKLAYTENENSTLTVELEQIRIDNKKITNDLLESDEVIQRLQVELQEKLFIIENLECKINEWKHNFTGLEESMKQQLLELQISNSELESQSQSSMKKHLSIHSSETYTIEPEYPDLHSVQGQLIRNSLNNLVVEPGNYSPQSLLTLCCNKIIDAIQPSDIEPSSVASSSNTNFTPTSSAGTQTAGCDCERLFTEKNIVLDENLDLKAKVDFLQSINFNLLKEQEEIREELKLLMEPANELQKKISSHKTNLSTLTATTYAENKLLKSQVKVLQHHNNRIYNVCQRDLPTFKKSLQELSSILKHTSLVNRLETSIKRFSLPVVLDKNSSVFKDESTLDGDLLMLDTNVTVASVDTTLLVQDQTCLDGTQIYLETDINTDVIETIDPNILHTQLQMLTVENEKLSEKLNVLKEENFTLHKKIETLSETVRPDISKIDAQSSPKKCGSSFVEVRQEPTENDRSTHNLCEYCKNSNLHSMQEKLTSEVNVLTQELIEVRSQKSDFEKRCNDLNEAIRAKDQFVSKINTLEQENNKQLIMINKLTNKLSAEHEELTKLQEENDSLSTQLMESIDESDDLRKELNSLKEINNALSVKCTDLEELLKGYTRACVRCARNINTLDISGMNKSLLNRSRSDSESSSRCNKLSTLQNELLAGREDCRTISEDVATIKNHLERGDLSISHSMDLDDSMGESNVFSLPKELHTASPTPNSFKILGERSADMYALDKAECFNYYIEKTGVENNITEEIKIIDLMKMFYNNLVAKHGNEIENLVNKLKDFEENRNHLTEKLDSITSDFAKTNEEIKEKDNRIAGIANALDQIKNNIHNINEEIVSCDADKNTVIVTMFKNNLLNIFDSEFDLSSVNVFDNLMNKVVNKHQNDLLEAMNRYSELQGHMELLASELNNVTDNLNQIKCQLSDKEQEYNLLKAQKEKVHEITSAVTLDIVQREQDLTKIINNGCQKLIEYNILTPNDIDSSEPVDKKMSILIGKLINQYKHNDQVFQEKHNLTLEVTKAKTAMEEKEQELESLKCEVEKLRELSKNATKELLLKNEALQTQKSLHEQLDEIYQKKVEENDANAKIIENLTQELDILKVTVSEKEDLLLSVQLQNNKQNSEDSETKAKIMELMESINSLEHENKKLKSVNEMITNESEQNAAQLAQADDTIKKNKTELDKLTAEILTLNKSLKESVDVIESLKFEAKSLVEQNVTLKKQFEEANNLCSRLKLNMSTLEKSAEIQCKIISRLKQEKESSNSMDIEKQKAVNEISEQLKALQEDFERLSEDKAKCDKEACELRETKESLERRVAELESQVESLGRPRGSIGNVDSRRRRQSLLDSKRTFSEEKLDTDHKNMDAYFGAQEKPEDMFMDVDDHSNRSTPAQNRRSDSFQSRNDESDEPSRPSSAVARRRRRQSIHDMHRHTQQDIQDHLNTLDEVKVNGASQQSEVASLKERLQACQQELEELKERYREVDEECEICAEYLRERDEQCMRLKNENTDLQQQITELNNKLLNASVVRKQKDAQRTFVNAAVNTDEDWANLHSVVVDRMSFDREVEKNKALQRSVDELRFKNGELKATLAKMQKAAERAARNKANLQELEATKMELETCKQKLEEYKERCKELDEECEICGEYLRERDEQLSRLKEARDDLEAKLQALQDKDAGNKAQTARKKRQSMHDQNRHSAPESRDAATETSVELASLHVERDNLKLISDSLQKENVQLKVALESMSQQRHAMEMQLRAAPALLPPVYVATGSAIVQNQHLTEVMKENQKLKKMNAKLITICKKRGKPLVESNRENDDPADMG